MMKKWMGVLCALMVCFGFLAANKALSETIELKMSHFMPTKHVQHSLVMAPWAKKIGDLTNGKVKITIFPGGALGKPPHQYDSAVKGITDIAFGLQSYTPGRFPLTSSLRLPFMVTTAEQGSKVLWRMYQKYLQQEYKDVKVLWLFMHGPGQIYTTKKQVKTIDDLKGMKIRSPGPIMSRVLKRLGAVPVHMPITQVYTALERKTVDGVAAPFEIMRPFRFYEQCKYAAVADIYSMTFFVVMNKKKFESLPPGIRKIIDDNSGLQMAIKAGRAYDQADVPGQKLFEDKGGAVYQLPAAEKEKWVNVSMPVKIDWIEDMEAKKLPGKEVLDYAEDMLPKVK